VDNDHEALERDKAGAVGLDPVRLVQDSGGAATTEQLLRHVSRWALRESVRCGRLSRAGRGVYVLPGLPTELVAAAELRGVVSHLSAAQYRRLDLVREPDALHITIAHGTSRNPRKETVIHRARNVDRDNQQPLVTSAVRTVLDCASTLPFPEAIAVADSALKYGFVTPDELTGAASRAHGAGRARRLRVAQSADGRAANAFESALRGVLLEAGITSFVPQFAIRTATRTVHADLADPVARVVLEADSFEFHGNRADLPWELVMFEPDTVVRLVRATMTTGRTPSSERTVPP
jgi:hypothetical protein